MLFILDKKYTRFVTVTIVMRSHNTTQCILLCDFRLHAHTNFWKFCLIHILRFPLKTLVISIETKHKCGIHAYCKISLLKRLNNFHLDLCVFQRSVDLFLF